jgi:purine nucleoside permease
MKKRLGPLAISFLVILMCVQRNLVLASEPLKIRAVVVTTFESGNDTGDQPGEFQFWVERDKLDQVLPFPAGYRDLRINADQTVLGVVTGGGATNASTSIMALGLDPRFDLSRAYWIIAAIAGVDPEDASIGSAAWANFVLDGDLVQELDSREAPPEWPYGRIVIGSTRPNELPNSRTLDSQKKYIVYELNSRLVDWAYTLTKNLKLMDTPQMAAYRATYKGYPKAMLPPFVLKGDSLGSSTYWHGKIMTEWANDWVKLWTGGRGNYVMTDMEDNGMLTALSRLSQAKKADLRRVLLLRTASNYCMQAPGQTASASLSAEYAGMIPSFEAAYQVGSTVLHELLKGWPKWEAKIPGDEQ